MKMTTKFILIPFLILWCVVFQSCSTIKSSPPQITIPLKFHIISDLNMKKGELEMKSWVSQQDITSEILPEVNRIWKPAGINFVSKEITTHDALNPANKAEIIDYIVKAKRDKNGKADRNRIKKLNRLINWNHHDGEAINIYFVPYLGETSQGNARRKAKRIFLTQHSDKASRAKRPPVRFKLIEAEPFEEGSMSRTLAHEIGHILGLKHPNKAQQDVFGRLMGGKRAGYILTQDEINAARILAEDIAQN